MMTYPSKIRLENTICSAGDDNISKTMCKWLTEPDLSHSALRTYLGAKRSLEESKSAPKSASKINHALFFFDFNDALQNCKTKFYLLGFEREPVLTISRCRNKFPRSSSVS